MEVQEQLVKGLNAHAVKVTNKRRIDGACEGKNVWDDLLRSIAPCYLDVFIVHAKEQNSTNVVTLRTKMHSFFNTCITLYIQKEI